MGTSNFNGNSGVELSNKISELETQLSELRLLNSLLGKYVVGAVATPIVQAAPTLVAHSTHVLTAPPAAKEVEAPLVYSTKRKEVKEHVPFALDEHSEKAKFVYGTRNYQMLPGDTTGRKTVIKTLAYHHRQGMPDQFYEFMNYSERKVAERRKTPYLLNWRLNEFAWIWDRMVNEVKRRVFVKVPLDPANLTPDAFREQVLGTWMKMEWERGVPLEESRCGIQMTDL